jgi:formate hydrogenlyase subunit 3/multisubunit Na+/H+ antiporter MnhD subunit
MATAMSALSIETLSRELLLLALLTPYLLLLLLGPSRTRPLGIALAPWAALPALFAAALVPLGTAFKIHGLFSDILLGIDKIGRLFLFFTSLLWWLGSWYVHGWFKQAAGQARFIGFYLATMAGNLGLILAQDLLTFYLFFTLMNFAAYGLVVHRGTLPARYAGRIYSNSHLG